MPGDGRRLGHGIADVGRGHGGGILVLVLVLRLLLLLPLLRRFTQPASVTEDVLLLLLHGQLLVIGARHWDVARFVANHVARVRHTVSVAATRTECRACAMLAAGLD